MNRAEKPLIWDLPTRLFHWALVACIAGSWFTAEQLDDAMDAHLLIGYTCLTLLMFRFTWGFVGPEHARFAGFVKGPGAVIRYAKKLRTGQAVKTAGHNPLGAVSVVAMLVAVAAQVTLGLFASDDFFYAGPYNGLLSEAGSDRATDWHKTVFDIIVVLIAVHLAAILWYRVRRGVNLLTPMLNGRKPRTELPPGAGIDGSRLALAAIVLVLCALAVWALVQFAPPPIDPFGF